MKIVIAGGDHAADYIIKNFNKRTNKLIIINPDKEIVKTLTKNHRIPVFYGDPYKKEILETANVKGCDLFIALGYKDTDNFVACQLAKKVFNAKKCICIVSNPKNVEIFRTLGVDSVISSTYLLASSVVNESSLENLAKSMSFDNDKIVMTEIVVKDSYAISNKMIMEINFPKTGTISCIYRKPSVIIPNGKTLIRPGDSMYIVSAVKDQKDIISFIRTEKY